MEKRKKKRAITLIEIMIVILLIGIIGGTLAFNMRGSMDQGRAFKTEQNIMRIQDILLLESAQTGNDLSIVVKNWQNVVKRSTMVRDPKEVCCDGWKKEFEVKEVDDEVVITSKKLEAFKKKHAPK
ncbi:MAG: prepilin-type N-terminal cleavage/methylation domain-containing protein [Chlamydiales bacterium]|nr:prepilin-type N-terminal cleavage/methylation domain-containing protein [Chlamydiales bacterium]